MKVNQLKKLNNKSGFTLLEIIIVIIIVGVLASLALPRFFSTVEYSKSSEALANLSALKSAMDRCKLTNGTYAAASCPITGLDVEDPNNNSGRRFNYTISAADATTFTLLAVRNTNDGGSATDGSGNPNSITLSVGATGDVTKTGSGIFSQIH